MYNTYKMMTACTTDEYLNKSLEDLVIDYKKTNKPFIRNKVIAAMFVKVFPMILKIQDKYYSLTSEQKVEHAIFHLIRSIKYYNNKNVKFSSFYYTHLTNQMKTLLTAENSLKKAAFQNIVRNNEDVLNLYTQNAEDKKLEYTDDYFSSNLEGCLNLSSEEKEYCQAILKGYTKTKDIAKELQLEKRYSLKRMTNPLTIVDIEKQQELEDKASERRIRKIKDSIKKKAMEYEKLNGTMMLAGFFN